jgi:hypothetical protein
MAGYHSFELCFLAAVYTNLLVNLHPMDFFFSPEPGAWEDNILRVAPDLLPLGSVELTEVWINGKNYDNFDREKLFVTLPDSDKTLKVRVRIAPVGMGFDVDVLSFEDGIANFALSGQLITSKLRYLKDEVEKLPNLRGLVLDLTNLQEIGDTGWNYLLFTKQRAGASFTVNLTNLSESVKKSLLEAELEEEFTLV